MSRPYSNGDPLRDGGHHQVNNNNPHPPPAISSIISFNCRGVKTKIKQLTSYIDTIMSWNKNTIIFLQETNQWTNKISTKYHQHSTNYIIALTSDPSITFSDDLDGRLVIASSTTSAFINIYGPPQPKERSSFWTKAEDLIRSKQQTIQINIICGDFNLQPQDVKLTHFSAALGLCRWKDSIPTFKSSKGAWIELDHILHKNCVHSVLKQELALSDHKALRIHLISSSATSRQDRIPVKLAPALLDGIDLSTIDSLLDLIRALKREHRMVISQYKMLQRIINMDPQPDQRIIDWFNTISLIIQPERKQQHGLVSSIHQPAPTTITQVSSDYFIHSDLAEEIARFPAIADFTFNHSDVQKALHKLRNDSAPGPGGLLPATLKRCSHRILDWCPHQVYNDALALSQTKRVVTIVNIPKASGGTRPISVISTLRRFASGILTAFLSRSLPQQLFDFQEGFREGGNIARHILSLDILRLSNPDNATLFIDFKAAYDTVDQRYLRHILHKIGGPTLVDHIDKLLRGLSPVGVPQGLPLSPLLFILALQPVLMAINRKYPSLRILAYADDVAIHGPVHILADVITLLDAYSITTGLKLNKAKCGFIDKPSPVPDIPTVSSYKYLGINITSPPDYSATIPEEEISDKLTRLFKSSTLTNSDFNLTLRSIVAYKATTRFIINAHQIEAAMYARLWRGWPEMIARSTLQQQRPSGIALQSIVAIETQQAKTLLLSLLTRRHVEWEELLRSLHPALTPFNLPVAIDHQHIGPKALPLPLWKRIVDILKTTDPPQLLIHRPAPATWQQWLIEPVAFNTNIIQQTGPTSAPIKASWLAHNSITTVQHVMDAAPRLKGGHRAFITSLQATIRSLAKAPRQQTATHTTQTQPQKRQKLTHTKSTIAPYDTSYTVHSYHPIKVVTSSKLTNKQADAHLLMSHDKLPCASSLQHRIKDWSCPLCGAPQDTPQHALIQCPHIPSILKRSSLPPIPSLHDLPLWLAHPDKHVNTWTAISKIIHKRKTGRIKTLKTHAEHTGTMT